MRPRAPRSILAWIAFSLLAWAVIILVIARAHSQPINPPWIPTIRTGNPNSVSPAPPVNQPYYDNTATPFTPYIWNPGTSAWVNAGGSGSGGTVTGSGTAGSLVKWTSASSIGNGDLSGSCTTSGSLTLLCPLFSSTVIGMVPASGGGTINFLRADGTWAAPPNSGGTVTSVAMTGDGTIFNVSVTGSPITTSGTLAPSLLAQSANRIFAGPTTGAATAPTFRAIVPADLPLFSSSAAGAVPASGGGTTNFLRADGTWAAAGGFTSPPNGQAIISNGTNAPAGVAPGSNGDVLGVAGGNWADITLAVSNITGAICTGTANALQFNSSGSMGCAKITDSGSVLAATETMSIAPVANSGILTSTGGSLTGSNATNGIDIAETWNTTGAPTGIKFAITNTAASASSFLLNILAGLSGTTSELSLAPNGNLFANGNFTQGASQSITSGTGGVVSGGGLTLAGTSAVQWVSRGQLNSANSTNINIGALGGIAQSQTLEFQATTTTNNNGANDQIVAGLSAGSGTSGDFLIQTGVKSNVSGTSATPTTAMTIKGETQQVNFAAQIAATSMTQSSAAQSGTVCQNTAGTLTYDATLGCLSSLEELKNIQKPISPTEALNELERLRPFWFAWKPDTAPGHHDKRIQPGLGAHATERVDARLAGYGPDGKLRGVRYQEMTAFLVAAIQGQQREITSLKSEIRSLERNHK